MNVQSVRFLDSALTPKAICTDFISLCYTSLFCGAGEIECVLAASSEAVPETDEYILTDTGDLFVVEQVARSTVTGQIAVRGKGVLSLLSRRIVPRGYTHRYSVEAEACRIVKGYGAAVFPAPLEVETPESTPAADLVVEAGDLLERVTHLVASARKGIRLTWNEGTGKFVFAVSSGTDRRLANAGGNDALYLSEGFGTLGGVCEVFDKSRYENRVTVRGSMASDGTVYTATVNAADYTFPDGFDDSAEALREGYVKSGIGVTMFTSRDESGERIFDREGYFAALRERGRQELALHRPALTLEAILTGGAEDKAQPGDVCTISSAATGAGVVRVIKKKYEFKSGLSRCSAELLALG